MKRQNFSSHSAYEPIVGYSRAVRVGPHIFVAGTAALDGSVVVGTNNPAAQARFILQKINAALQQAGAQLSHVVRTRIYITDLQHWEAIGKVHGEFFGSIRPAATLVVVSALIQPELLVEIEADALLESDS